MNTDILISVKRKTSKLVGYREVSVREKAEPGTYILEKKNIST